MRRFIVVLLIIFISLSILTVTLAQEEHPSTEGDSEFDATSTSLMSHPPQMIPTTSTINLSATEVDPAVITAVSATDTCDNATDLTVPGGGSAIVNSFTTDAGDPPLSCAWGTSSSLQGYRTAWYKFTAPNNGTVTIDTTGSSYDTVVSVFTDSDPEDAINACSSLQLLSCNDDEHGFTSRNRITVAKNRTYYIQVADWQSGVSGNADLLISLEIDPINSLWKQQGVIPTARSRHATAIVGNDIYMIGGQTTNFDPFGGSAPTLTTAADKYSTSGGSWSPLNDLPGIAGFSNTTAVYVNSSNGGNCTQGCIYLPGGYTGGAAFDDTHWAYDIAISSWIEKSAIDDSASWPDGVPFAWSTAVAKPDQTGYYLMGGLSSQPAITETAVIHNNVLFYRTSDDTWLSSPPNMATARYAHTAAYVGGQICVIGGITDALQLLPNGECWNPNGGGSWNPMAALNIARYGAGSSVGPDGKWYVYGGSDGNHQAISTMEVYDPARPASGWVQLNVNYDLGASAGVLERSWPRGGFVNNHLWAIGGNATVGSFPAIPTMERLFVGQEILLLPIVSKSGASTDNDHFGVAQPIGFNSAVHHNFEELQDYFDVYTFDLTGSTAVTVKLTQIPSGSDYNFSIYSDNKQLWATANNPSNLDESVTITLNAGQYFLMVERAFPFGFPNTANYRLIVEK